MKNKIKYIGIAVVVIILAFVFYKKVYEPKHTFVVVSPKEGDLQVSVKGVGNVDALHTYPITAQTGGKIIKILADNGAYVKKGELLVEIDGIDLEQQKEAAIASMSKANFDIRAAQNDLASQKSQKTLVQITFDRYKRLLEKGFVSKAEYDKATADLNSIDATMAATAARIDAAKAAANGASKTVAAFGERVNRLKIYAPVDGYIVSRDAEVAQSVSSSTPILTLVDPKTLWVKTKIDERISSNVQLAQEATIILRSQPKKSYTGVVKRISATTDQITLEREINIAFDSIPMPFYMNEQAQVQITTQSYKNILKVPANTIVTMDKRIGFWIVENSSAKFIDANITAQNDTEVLLANIDKNSRIIVPDTTKKTLVDGMKIYE